MSAEEIVADQFFVNRNGKIFGPFTQEAVKLAANTNKLTADDLISTSKDGPWKKLQGSAEEAGPADDGAGPYDSFGEESDDSRSDNDSHNALPPLPVSPRQATRQRPAIDDEDDNPYSSFKSKNASRETMVIGSARVASPLQRLVAAIVDSFAGFVFVLPGIVPLIIAIQTADPRDQDIPPIAIAGFALMALGAFALIACQLYLQINRAQSIGKWYCNLRIFDVETMQPAGFFKNWFLRTFVNLLLNCIPLFGGIYGVVDLCFIFSDNHRCLHDLLAGTQVIDISPQS